MQNYFDLTGKVALVTGASSGLGVQMAKALAKAGADIAITARRKEKLLAVQKEIEALGVRCYVHVCDVSNLEQIQETVAAVEKNCSKIDILCNNAGTNGNTGKAWPAEEQPTDNWDYIIRVNLCAPYYMAREVAKGMIKRGGGRIIMTGSIHSAVGMAEIPISAYATSKGGIAMMTKQLAVEWAKHGITVNAICPAYFRTELTEDVVGDEGFKQVVANHCPMGRLGKEGELDGAVIYFASDASSYTTGQLLWIDGGWTAI